MSDDQFGKTFSGSVEFTHKCTGDSARDREIERLAFKLFTEMFKEFNVVYTKALAVILKKEAIQHLDNKYREEIYVRASVSTDVTFNQLMESLKTPTEN